MNVLEASVSDQIRAETYPRLSSLREGKGSWALLQLVLLVVINLPVAAQITPTPHAVEQSESGAAFVRVPLAGHTMAILQRAD